MYLTRLDETRHDVPLFNEMYKKRMKSQYEKYFQPLTFVEGDLVLIYDQAHDNLGT
jgi:hypothetical protein